MAESSLAVQDQAGREVGVRYSRMVANSVAVMEVVDRTNELPRKVVELVNEKGAVVEVREELVQPDGMPDAVFHLHRDAFKADKDVPFYLKAHRNRVELAQRIAGDRNNAPPELAKLVISVVQAPRKEYEVIDVTPVEGK